MTTTDPLPTTVGFNFGCALEALKSGARVHRAGWNGKGMWLVLVEAESVMYRDDVQGAVPESPWCAPGAKKATPAPFIAMKTVDNKLVPWLASQTDLLADDWDVVRSN